MEVWNTMNKKSFVSKKKREEVWNTICLFCPRSGWKVLSAGEARPKEEEERS